METRIIDESIKQTAGKPRLSLAWELPMHDIALTAVREYGEKKYAPDNWKQVPPHYWADAICRHWAKYLSGEQYDKESGLPHLWHIQCNLAYLMEDEANEIWNETTDAIR